mgnify:CR=1 FL=1
MKKIKVLIQDKNTLKLIEPGETGDLIDLTKIYQLDIGHKLPARHQ